LAFGQFTPLEYLHDDDAREGGSVTSIHKEKPAPGCQTEARAGGITVGGHRLPSLYRRVSIEWFFVEGKKESKKMN
jgi:hypothetical protein